MKIITRTIYGSSLQTSLLMGLDFEIVPKSTLNEKFNIEAETPLPDGIIPNIKYFCIGNGGHRIKVGADSIPYTTPINHRGSDAALYNHLPFVLREVGDDLDLASRAKYGLRREESHNGVTYIAYYLKRLDVTGVQNTMVHTRVIDGVVTTTPFVPGNDNLNPTPPEMPNEGVISTNGDYLSSSAIITVNFSEDDVEELKNVCRVIYDNENRAAISEIGLCSGYDKTVVANSPNGQFNYKEAIGVQVATFITTDYFPVGMTNRGFDLYIEAGATEPLLGEAVEE